MIRRNATLTSLAMAALALVLAACGGGNGNTTASTSPSKSSSARAGTVDAARTNLGTILVDVQGRTLYLFKKDSGTKSACFGECAVDWPPLRSAGRPTARGGANASLLATTPRSDGSPEVTYFGHPLYRFAGDKRPGDTNGQGLNAFGGEWLVLSPAGNALTSPAASSGGNGVY
jgi:predicted lipoprotein with Yx(FWY)xxD motif